VGGHENFFLRKAKNENLIVSEPDIYLSPTAIVYSGYPCPRKKVLDLLFRDVIFSTNIHCLMGNILHQIFQNLFDHVKKTNKSISMKQVKSESSRVIRLFIEEI